MLCHNGKFRQQGDHWFFLEIIFVKGLIWARYSSGTLLIEELSKPVLVYLVLSYLYNLLSQLSLCIRSNLSFGLIHKIHYLKIYGIFHFSDIQCCIIFFPVKNGIFLDLYPWIQPLPAKKTLACYIPLDSKFKVDYEYQIFINQEWHCNFWLCFKT